jgi:hypothetical protein
MLLRAFHPWLKMEATEVEGLEESVAQIAAQQESVLQTIAAAQESLLKLDVTLASCS